MVREVAVVGRGSECDRVLCVPARLTASIQIFNNTAVADKECGGPQTRVDVGALPTRRAIFQRLLGLRFSSLHGPVVSEGSTAVLHTAGDGALPSGSTIFLLAGRARLRLAS